MRVIIEADGGSRGNPGPSGYGTVVIDESTGSVIASLKGHLGVTTNNVAEYTALIAGLRYAERVGATHITVRMDSKLVVEQMSGRWKVKHPNMIKLKAEALSLASNFSIRYEWVPRAMNARADKLANEAMDEH